MSAMADRLFFYRNEEFQTQSCMLWGQQLFIEQSLTPESFSTFWDNIHVLRGESKTAYAANQCEILQDIAIANMQIELRGDGLFISDLSDSGLVAVLDYRDSTNGELRGETLQRALESFEGNVETVYDALNHLINSHHHPTFSGTIARQAVGLSEENTAVVFSVIDNILTEEEKFPAATGPDKLRRNEEIANAAFPKFLEELDKQNTQVLRDGLDELGEFGERRKQAIEALLDYREGLFTETKTLVVLYC